MCFLIVDEELLVGQLSNKIDIYTLETFEKTNTVEMLVSPISLFLIEHFILVCNDSGKVNFLNR